MRACDSARQLSRLPIRQLSGRLWRGRIGRPIAGPLSVPLPSRPSCSARTPLCPSPPALPTLDVGTPGRAAPWRRGGGAGGRGALTARDGARRLSLGRRHPHSGHPGQQVGFCEARNLNVMGQNRIEYPWSEVLSGGWWVAVVRLVAQAMWVGKRAEGRAAGGRAAASFLSPTSPCRPHPSCRPSTLPTHPPTRPTPLPAAFCRCRLPSLAWVWPWV